MRWPLMLPSQRNVQTRINTKKQLLRWHKCQLGHTALCRCSLQAIPTALRGAFQSCGQNCAGAERFIVHRAVHDQFVARVADTARRMRQGPPLGPHPVDAGAMCLPGLARKVDELVQDAVAGGAQVSSRPKQHAHSRHVQGWHA